MTKLLQSPWSVALIGCLLYLATTVIVLNPAKFPKMPAAKPHYSADNDPSWKFRNPDLDQWIAQIKAKKDSLDSREQQLNELQTRLNVEWQEISIVTQTVAQLQQSFNQRVVQFKAQQLDNIKKQAKLLSAMSPEGAAAMLGEMPDADAVRILFMMKPDVASPILDTWSKSGQVGARRAAELTEQLRQVLPPPANTNQNNF